MTLPYTLWHARSRRDAAGRGEGPLRGSLSGPSGPPRPEALSRRVRAIALGSERDPESSDAASVRPALFDDSALEEQIDKALQNPPPRQITRSSLPAYTHYLLDVAVAILRAIPTTPDGPGCDPAVAGATTELRARVRHMTQTMQHDVSYTVLIVSLLYLLRYRQGLVRVVRVADTRDSRRVRHGIAGEAAGAVSEDRCDGERPPGTDRVVAVAYAPYPRDVLLLGALVLASKYVNDVHTANAHWARVFEMAPALLNCVERHVLQGMRHRMHLGPAGFAAWVAFLFDSQRLQAYLRPVRKV